MKKILVVVPHPDDETLGCGGTLLRHKEAGDEIHWLIVTGITEKSGFLPERVLRENREIEAVASSYGFASVHNLQFIPARLDVVPMADLIINIGNVFSNVKPTTIYLPFSGDVHTDHAVVFDAVSSCSKWFRYDSIQSICAYETLSETDFFINPDRNCFRPNLFVDISGYLEKKIEIMKIYASELGEFPFPRSEKAIRALAIVRGAAAGCNAAEAFMVLKEIVRGIT